MKIAIVHPWFLAFGGAEHTVNVLAGMFPGADFFTLFYNERDLPPKLRGRRIEASSLNWIPLKYQFYRFLLPLYPRLFEALDLRGYDLILSSDSCVAKGILIDQHARHICYCHSPMRGLWDFRFEFRDLLPSFARPFFTWLTHSVRQWDFQAAQRVDYFVANSEYVAERIFRYYRRDCKIIYPPVEVHTAPPSSEHGDYYISVGRLTETKHVDILIRACNQLGRRLVIVGRGRQASALKRIAGPTIEFIGHADDKELIKLYRNCRALLFASNEDFGIVPVEAQSYGRPVIAFGHGGVKETVIDIESAQGEGTTGVFFAEQTSEALSEAILRFEAVESTFNPQEIQQHSFRYSVGRFEADFRALVDNVAHEAGFTP